MDEDTDDACLMGYRRDSTLAERFWPTISIGAEDECWPTNSYKDKNGYGKYGRLRRSHRVAFELANGPIPPGMYVCHKCDNPPCCNPKHLFLGTNQENLEDRNRKGRTMKGEAHYNARLTLADVELIRTSSMSGRELANKLGVTDAHISRIRHGVKWK